MEPPPFFANPPPPAAGAGIPGPLDAPPALPPNGKLSPNPAFCRLDARPACRLFIIFMSAASHSPAVSPSPSSGAHAAHPGDAERLAALEQYEAGMKYFGQQKFDKAKSWLEKASLSPAYDIAERARVHLSVCNQRLQSAPPALRTAEEHYNAAIWRLNLGQFDEAREHLERAQKLEGKTAHTEYALAAVFAQRNDPDAAIQHLRQAIAMDPRNRLLARGDADFKPLMEDPRFTEEIYPD